MRSFSTSSAKEEKAFHWWVPITYTADFKNIGSTWLALNETRKSFLLDVPVSEDRWLIFNIDQMGTIGKANHASKSTAHYWDPFH